MKPFLFPLFIVILFANSYRVRSQSFELVKNLNPTGDGSPANFKEFDSLLYFVALDGSNRVLWKTDGTALNTSIAIPSLSISSRINIYNDYMFFIADNGEGKDLYRSDGTAEGTYKLTNYRASIIGNFVFHKDYIYYPVLNNTSLNYFIYKTHYQSGISSPLDMNYCMFGSRIIKYKNKLYFSGSHISDLSNDEIYSTDGTTVSLLKEINPSGASRIHLLRIYDSQLYFRGLDGTNNHSHLYKTDGTSNGTVQVKKSISGWKGNHIIYNNEFYFGLTGLKEGGLWKTDGITLTRVKDFLRIHSMVNYNDKIILLAEELGLDKKLWISDGTTSGTIPFLQPDVDGQFDVKGYYIFNDTLYFSGSTSENGMEMWQTDGTESGSRITEELIPGTQGSLSSNFFEFNGELFLSATDGIHGIELFKLVDEIILTDNKNPASKSFNIFPNPVKDKLKIKSDYFITNAIILNQLGQTVKQIELNSSGEMSINLEDLTSGFYLLTLTDADGNSRMEKFLKD